MAFKGYHRRVLSDTKTGRNRQVFITSRVYEMLALWKSAAGDPEQGDFIFSAKDGQLFDRGILTKRLAWASKKAGMVHVHSHVLRHTYAAWVLTAGYTARSS